jgi:hypothetical protein
MCQMAARVSTNARAGLRFDESLPAAGRVIAE